MKRVSMLLSILIVLVVASDVAARDFPSRDITNVVPYSAGGGTDSVNRIISQAMGPFLGVNINVVNKTGGATGSVGMNYVWGRPHDGYTLAGQAESNVNAGILGGFNKKFDVWHLYLVGGSPDIISVTANSPYKTLRELVEAAKTNPGGIKATGSGQGSIHHLNILAFEKGTGAKFHFIPYKGSSEGLNAAMTGEVSVAVNTLAEQQQLIRSGKLRALGMLTPDPFTLENVGVIPSTFSEYPQLSQHLPISQILGFAVPADTPNNAKAVLKEAFDKAMQTDTVKNWAKENYYTLSGKSGEEAQAIFSRLESLFTWTLWELGDAKVSPESLGIPKP